MSESIVSHVAGIYFGYIFLIINRLIFIGTEPLSAKSIDDDIHWLVHAFQCTLIPLFDIYV